MEVRNNAHSYFTASKKQVEKVKSTIANYVSFSNRQQKCYYVI